MFFISFKIITYYLKNQNPVMLPVPSVTNVIADEHSHFRYGIKAFLVNQQWKIIKL